MYSEGVGTVNSFYVIIHIRVYVKLPKWKIPGLSRNYVSIKKPNFDPAPPPPCHPNVIFADPPLPRRHVII